MIVSKVWVYLGSILIAFACFWHWASYLQQSQDAVALNIQVNEQPPETIPIFSDRVATETIALQQTITPNLLIIPVVATEQADPVHIRLLQHNTVLEAWTVIPSNYPETGDGVRHVSLHFSTPKTLTGDIQLIVSASTVTDKTPEKISALVIEKADDQYAGVHYKIAQNNKKGVIGLAFVEERTNYQLLIHQFKSKPLAAINLTLLKLAFILLLTSLPSVFVRSLVGTNPDTSERSA